MATHVILMVRKDAMLTHVRKRRALSIKIGALIKRKGLPMSPKVL